MDSRSLSHTAGYLRGHLETFSSFMWWIKQVKQVFFAPKQSMCTALWQKKNRKIQLKNVKKRPVLICGCKKVSFPKSPNADASGWHQARPTIQHKERVKGLKKKNPWTCSGWKFRTAEEEELEDKWPWTETIWELWMIERKTFSHLF